MTEDGTIEAKARFNQGNASFRKAESLIPSDLNSALENCKKSVSYYQDALELEPEFREAAENIETVRYTMKSILDQIEQQKKQSEEENQDKSKDTEKKQPEQSSEPDNKDNESEDKANKSEDQDSSEEDQSDSAGEHDQNKEENGKQKKSTAKESGKKPKDISDMLKEDAESILDEEKKNKEHRRAKVSGRFSGPDRDW